MVLTRHVVAARYLVDVVAAFNVWVRCRDLTNDCQARCLLLIDAALARIVLLTGFIRVKWYVMSCAGACIALRVLTAPDVVLITFIFVNMPVVAAFSVTTEVPWDALESSLRCKTIKP
jgi:hypothetical protein